MQLFEDWKVKLYTLKPNCLLGQIQSQKQFLLYTCEQNLTVKNPI